MDAKTDDKSAGKCPFTGGTRGHRNRDWWPDALDIEMLHRNSALSDPMGKDFDYAKEFKTLDLNAVIKDLHGPDDELAALVAGRLRPLRRTDDPPGVARRRHLPHHRRPWRRRHRPAALRAAELVAGQRQPRQGAPAACGRSSRSTARNSHGPTCWSWPATSRWSRWASRRSVSPAAAPTCGSRKSCYWGPEGTWLGDERYSGERQLA